MLPLGLFLYPIKMGTHSTITHPSKTNLKRLRSTNEIAKISYYLTAYNC